MLLEEEEEKKVFLLESTLLIGSTRSAALYYVKSWEEKDVKDESDGALMELSNSISHLWAKHVDCVCVCVMKSKPNCDQMIGAL